MAVQKQILDLYRNDKAYRQAHESVLSATFGEYFSLLQTYRCTRIRSIRRAARKRLRKLQRTLPRITKFDWFVLSNKNGYYDRPC